MRRLVFLLVLELAGAAHAQQTEKATSVAGCFWCTEEVFEKVPGVIRGLGYTGGKVKNPSYAGLERPHWLHRGCRSPSTLKGELRGPRHLLAQP
jgi:hypothetical protein